MSPFRGTLLLVVCALATAGAGGGRSLEEVSVGAAPSPIVCGEIPISRYNPNATVGYSPTWYDKNSTNTTNTTSFASDEEPTGAPVTEESFSPSNAPVSTETNQPSKKPVATAQPTMKPSESPSDEPSLKPTTKPTDKPSATPSVEPTMKPTGKPTESPSSEPSSGPSVKPTGKPTDSPTVHPSASPSTEPSRKPTGKPTAQPSAQPSNEPSRKPTGSPTAKPSENPSEEPSGKPTLTPTKAPTKVPTSAPTNAPTQAPTQAPTMAPTKAPTKAPTSAPTKAPTNTPTKAPTNTPTKAPTKNPTKAPTTNPTKAPTRSPTKVPTKQPTSNPTAKPTNKPTMPKSAIDCPYVNLDFEGLEAGQYITTELKQKYGVTVKANSGRGAYTPNGAARVLDTANKPSGSDDKALSPNSGCGGQGNGAGGAPSSPYANCDPLGKVLVVQYASYSAPRANYDRSYLTFTFDEPVNLQAVVFAESIGNLASKYELTKSDKSVVNVTMPIGGQNGKIRTVFGDKGKGVKSFKVTLERGGAIAAIEYSWCVPDQPPTPAPTYDAGACPETRLDFSTLTPGVYFRDELMAKFKVQVFAKLGTGGYAPGGKAMVIDSSKPSKADLDLGSPNESCEGPGKGLGGSVGSKYQNCEPLGNVVFVQESDTAYADNIEGKKSGLLFRFTEPATVHRFKVFDVDGPHSVQTVLSLADGTTKYVYTAPTGDNGVATVRINTDNVKEVLINFPQGGAVAQMDYTMCSLIPTPAPTYSPLCPDVDLDFNLLLPGSYIGDQLWDEYGIKFATESTGGGFRPNNTARVFDTSNPGNKTHGSPDIGSPNESCGGPGVGQGGNLASRYENCGEGLGNVLIIQSSSKNPVPQYYRNGTKFKAYFKVASFVESVTMIVGLGCKQMKFTVTQDPYKITTIFGPENVEANGVFTVPIGLHNVIRIDIDMPFGGALADIKYTWCPFNTKAPSAAPKGLPTLAPTKKPVSVGVPVALPPTMQPIEYRTDCAATILDFEGQPRGQYIKNEFLLSHGVRISARSWNGGYVPNSAARIFDTSEPGDYGDGDPDLGSPNQSCGGPGVGDGGAIGSPYENCKPLGKVLIVQESLKATPSDHEKSFELEFNFIYPAYVDKVQVMDNDGCNCDPVKFTLYLADGTKVVKYGASATGNNGVAWVYLEVERVVRMTAYFPTSGALSSLNYILCWPGLL